MEKKNHTGMFFGGGRKPEKKCTDSRSATQAKDWGE